MKEMIQNFKSVMEALPIKVYDLLSNVWGWVITLFVAAGAFLGGRLPLLSYIGIAVLIDLLWGIATAVKAKKFILSQLIAKSAVKIFAYVSIYALVALAEKGIGEDFLVASIAVGSVLITAELWSVLGHIAIAYPDWMVVRLLKRYLKGEMSKKLGIPEDELDKILYKKDDKATDNPETK
jgi:hypothetical protein